MYGSLAAAHPEVSEQQAQSTEREKVFRVLGKSASAPPDLISDIIKREDWSESPFGDPERGEKEPLLQSDPAQRYVPKKYYPGSGKLNTIEESDEEHSPKSPLNKEHFWQDKVDVDTKKKTVFLSSTKTVLITVCVCVICFSTSTVTLPMYLSSMKRAGSDVYVALLLASVWILVIITGLLAIIKFIFIKDIKLKPNTPVVYAVGLGGLLGGAMVILSYSAVPWRTHNALHPILQITILPVASLLTTSPLHRKSLRPCQYISLVVQLLGVLLALFPMIFDFARAENDLLVPWYYTLMYIIVCAVITAVFVLLSVAVNKCKDNVVVVLTWVMCAQMVTIASLFWTNILPELGMASDFGFFTRHFTEGVACFFGTQDGCWTSVVPRSVVFIASWTGSVLTLLMLSVSPAGLLYITSVLLLASPLATLFWSLFTDWPHFAFYPLYDSQSSLFTMAGLGVSILGLLLFVYAALSKTDKHKKELEPVLCRQSSQVHIGRRELFPKRIRCSTYAGESICQPFMKRLTSESNLISRETASASNKGNSFFPLKNSQPVLTPTLSNQAKMDKAGSSPVLVSI